MIQPLQYRYEYVTFGVKNFKEGKLQVPLPDKTYTDIDGNVSKWLREKSKQKQVHRFPGDGEEELFDYIINTLKIRVSWLYGKVIRKEKGLVLFSVSACTLNTDLEVLIRDSLRIDAFEMPQYGCGE